VVVHVVEPEAALLPGQVYAGAICGVTYGRIDAGDHQQA